MKRHVELAGFVLLGFAVTCASSVLLGLLPSVGLFRSAPSPSPQSAFSIPFTFALSLLCGGAITGYLCSQRVRTKRGFVWITPGLYFLLLDAAIFIYYADQMCPGLPEAMGMIGLLTFLISWAGVGIGHYVRREILKDRQKDMAAGK